MTPPSDRALQVVDQIHPDADKYTGAAMKIHAALRDHMARKIDEGFPGYDKMMAGLQCIADGCEMPGCHAAQILRDIGVDP